MEQQHVHNRSAFRRIGLVESVISGMKWGKAPWLDGLSAEHLQYSGVKGSGVMVRESGGKTPLKLKYFWFLDVRWKPQICPVF